MLKLFLYLVEDEQIGGRRHSLRGRRGLQRRVWGSHSGLGPRAISGHCGLGPGGVALLVLLHHDAAEAGAEGQRRVAWKYKRRGL